MQLSPKYSVPDISCQKSIKLSSGQKPYPQNQTKTTSNIQNRQEMNYFISSSKSTHINPNQQQSSPNLANIIPKNKLSQQHSHHMLGHHRNISTGVKDIDQSQGQLNQYNSLQNFDQIQQNNQHINQYDSTLNKNDIKNKLLDILTTKNDKSFGGLSNQIFGKNSTLSYDFLLYQKQKCKDLQNNSIFIGLNVLSPKGSSQNHAQTQKSKKRTPKKKSPYNRLSERTGQQYCIENSQQSPFSQNSKQQRTEGSSEKKKALSNDKSLNQKNSYNINYLDENINEIKKKYKAKEQQSFTQMLITKPKEHIVPHSAKNPQNYQDFKSKFMSTRRCSNPNLKEKITKSNKNLNQLKKISECSSPYNQRLIVKSSKQTSPEAIAIKKKNNNLNNKHKKSPLKNIKDFQNSSNSQVLGFKQRRPPILHESDQQTTTIEVKESINNTILKQFQKSQLKYILRSQPGSTKNAILSLTPKSTQNIHQNNFILQHQNSVSSPQQGVSPDHYEQFEKNRDALQEIILNPKNYSKSNNLQLQKLQQIFKDIQSPQNNNHQPSKVQSQRLQYNNYTNQQVQSQLSQSFQTQPQNYNKSQHYHQQMPQDQYQSINHQQEQQQLNYQQQQQMKEANQLKMLLSKIKTRTQTQLNSYKEKEQQWQREKKALQDEVNFFKDMVKSQENIERIMGQADINQLFN